jgi:hypothetical protein
MKEDKRSYEVVPHAYNIHTWISLDLPTKRQELQGTDEHTSVMPQGK